jgi:multidrug efflux pump subunit AcrA (membrane-fusion protein)
MPVSSMILNSKPINQANIYQATLISRHSISLQPQISGQVSGIYVNAGDKVKAGTTLIAIDQKKQQAILNSSKADANAFKAIIAQSKSLLSSYEIQQQALLSNVELNQKLYDRYSSLYLKKSVSQQDLEKYTDSLNKAKSELNSNIAQIQAQKSAIITAQSNYAKAISAIQEQSVQLRYYKITAPYSGIVGDIPVKLGSSVNTDTKLISITQNNPLEVNVGLPVDKVFEIRKGLPIEILDNNNNVVGTSKISFISPSVNTETQTILIKSILYNTSEIFKADQSVKVRVIFNQTNGILAPTSAISHMTGQDFVFLITNKGKQQFVKQQPVTLGEIQGDKYVILSGLKSLDTIVSQGIQKLMDGMPVTAMPEGK